MSQTSVILSTKPEFAEKIFKEEKKWEFRKRIPKDVCHINQIFFYETSPVKKITGVGILGRINIKGPPLEVWELCKDKGGISEEEFLNYCGDAVEIYALKIKESRRFEKPFDPKKAEWWRRPPQNFMYARPEWIEELKAKGVIQMLRKGDYYIGDPSYVLTENNGHDWEEILRNTLYFGLFETEEDMERNHESRTRKDGEFTIDNVKIVCYETLFGDGTYYDNEMREYSVDSGMIAAIPTRLVPNYDETTLGHIIHFESDFKTSSRAGILKFGNVVIDTVW